MEVVCTTCGNEFDTGSAACPFCGAKRKRSLAKKEQQHRRINLERGMPLVKDALHKMELELKLAGSEGYRVVTLIHGYGSSGKGGAIRREVRRRLIYFKDQGRINDLLPGEEFSRNRSHSRHLLRRFPFLNQHRDLNRGNRGITLVVL